MPRHTLYAYAEGNDLDELASTLVARIEGFISTRTWTSGRAWLVNQKRSPEDLYSDWDLGLNLELPDTGLEPLGWFNDVEAIAYFFAALYGELGREFVIGIGDNETGVSEDLFWVETTVPNIDELKMIVGVDAHR